MRPPGCPDGTGAPPAAARRRSRDASSSAATVGQALAAARTAGVDRLDAQLLVGAVLGRPRSWLLAHGEQALDAAQVLRFEALCRRRADGEPLAYLVGEKEFHGLVLAVDRAVLVPRPDTETLVDWALELLPVAPARPVVADLGTGSGAIALAIAHARPAASVCGVDVSADALAVAEANGRRLAITVEWRQGDWWAALGGRRVDIALSNPPYIAAADPHLAALRHEPQIALTPGGDGLGAVRALVGGALDHLRPGGWLLMEHGHDQAESVRHMLNLHGFIDVATRRDLAGLPRCSGGRVPAPL